MNTQEILVLSVLCLCIGQGYAKQPSIHIEYVGVGKQKEQEREGKRTKEGERREGEEGKKEEKKGRGYKFVKNIKKIKIFFINYLNKRAPNPASLAKLITQQIVNNSATFLDWYAKEKYNKKERHGKKNRSKD